MRLYIAILLISISCSTWAQSTTPTSKSPDPTVVNIAPTTTTIASTTQVPSTISTNEEVHKTTTQNVNPTFENVETTSTIAESTTTISQEEAYEKQKSQYIEGRKKMFEIMKKDHELCITGDERSPVDLKFESALPVYLPAVEFVNYDSTGNVWEESTNHSAALTGFSGWKNAPFIRGGALEGEYVLTEFHQTEYTATSFYPTDSVQMTHSINQAFYDYETHFVHVKRGMTLENARGVPGAIVIVAVEYIQNGTMVPASPALVPLSESEIEWKKEIYPTEINGTLNEWIKPQELIPKDTTNFFSYNGSMPHTPCSPGVTWIVLSTPVDLNRENFQKVSVRNRRTTTRTSVAYIAEPPTIGNRSVIFNFGELKNPLLEQGHSIYFIMLIALCTVAVTAISWIAVEKYAKQPIEKGYVKYFVQK